MELHKNTRTSLRVFFWAHCEYRSALGSNTPKNPVISQDCIVAKQLFYSQPVLCKENLILLLAHCHIAGR
jgi:hypothetical protein